MDLLSGVFIAVECTVIFYIISCIWDPPLGTPLVLYIYTCGLFDLNASSQHDGKSDIRISRPVLYTTYGIPAAAMPQRNRACLQRNSIGTID